MLWALGLQRRAAASHVSSPGSLKGTLKAEAKVLLDGQARAFWFSLGYLGQPDGGTTSVMRKDAAMTFLPSHRTAHALRRGHGEIATRSKYLL